MAAAKRSPLLYIVLIGGVVSLILLVTGFLLPGWVVIRYGTGAIDGPPKDFIDPNDPDSGFDNEEDPHSLEKRSAHSSESSESHENSENEKHFDFDQDHQTMKMGLWFGRNCTHKKNGFREEFGWRKKKGRCHDKCSTLSTEKALGVLADASVLHDFFESMGHHKEDEEHQVWADSSKRTHATHRLCRYLWSLRVEMIIALTLTLVGLCLSAVVFKKVDNCKCLNVLAAIFFICAGCCVMLPVLKVGGMHCHLRRAIKNNDLADRVNVGFPPALLVSFVGALFVIISAVLLLVHLCKTVRKHRCQKSGTGWNRFVNEKTPADNEKGPVLVFASPVEADALPEKMPITDFVDAEKSTIA